jgi:hypothetical protein
MGQVMQTKAQTSRIRSLVDGKVAMAKSAISPQLECLQSPTSQFGISLPPPPWGNELILRRLGFQSVNCRN